MPSLKQGLWCQETHGRELGHTLSLEGDLSLGPIVHQCFLEAAPPPKNGLLPHSSLGVFSGPASLCQRLWGGSGLGTCTPRFSEGLSGYSGLSLYLWDSVGRGQAGLHTGSVCFWERVAEN